MELAGLYVPRFVIFFLVKFYERDRFLYHQFGNGDR